MDKGEGKCLCWGVGGGEGDVERGVGIGEGKCVGVWGEVRADVERGVTGGMGVEGRCGEVCWGCGER